MTPLSDMIDLEPVVVAMGTCRMLRLRRVGAVYFVENLLGKDWKVVAISKGQDARREAFEWLNRANAEVIETSLKDRNARYDREADTAHASGV